MHLKRQSHSSQSEAKNGESKSIGQLCFGKTRHSHEVRPSIGAHRAGYRFVREENPAALEIYCGIYGCLVRDVPASVFQMQEHLTALRFLERVTETELVLT